ncbi:hypothetical protein B0O99DRAFT_703085 [Bisporella sp. PMI_857]|nr:hypothetical protein B0O99DRAFT_703085 [Bisporella sp. PMI_857]
MKPGDCNRYEITNLWRPLVEPCENFPLALCDYHSVDLENDLEVEDLISPHCHGSYITTFYFGHNDKKKS